MATPFLSSEDFDERAHRLYNAGEYERALETLREGLQQYTDAVELHVGLGYVRLARDEFAWARQSFDRALQLEPDHEDAWVGLGETLLKFGETGTALACFARIDELGLGQDLELGLTIGRALYREGLYHESRQRLTALAAAHPDAAEVRGALGYTLHALGDEIGARRELHRALRSDPEFHEARIYLSHLLYERGDFEGALGELERVPPAEHWDPLSLWRLIDLKCSLTSLEESDPVLEPWRARVAELTTEPDDIDHLLAEVEGAFVEGNDEPAATPVADAQPRTIRPARAVPRLEVPGTDERIHRVRTADGSVFTGTWEEIVLRMRDAHSDTDEPLAAFMRRAALRIRQLTGSELPCEDPEAFLRASEALGLLRIEE